MVNVWRDAQVFALARSDDGVARQVPLMEKQPDVTLMPLPAVVVPRPRVSDPKDALAEKRFVEEAVVEKRLVVVALVNVLLPEKELLFARSVVEETTMFAVPSKVTPLIVRPVWRAVAVFALPPILSEAAVPVSPVPAPVNEEPVTVPVEVKFPTTVEEELAM